MSLLIPYALIALAVIRPVAGHFAWTWFHKESAPTTGRQEGMMGGARYPRPDSFQWGGAVALGALLGAVWPAVALWTLSAVLGPVGAERREYLHARRKHLDARERHVADLEATLDLQGDR